MTQAYGRFEPYSTVKKDVNILFLQFEYLVTAISKFGLICVFAVSFFSLVEASTVFGPENYKRDSNAPDFITETFEIIDPARTYILSISNGGLIDGQFEKVSNSVFILNGVQIIGPNEFNQNVPFVEKQVFLLHGTNTLSIELRGKPNGGVTVSIRSSVDNENPVITATLNPVPNDNGWNQSDVTVTFMCSDSGSGVSVCPAPLTITNQGFTTISGTAEDNAGNSSNVTLSLKIDKIAPSVQIQSPVNGTTIVAQDITISGIVSESTSGIDSLTCNSIAALVVGSSFTCLIPLAVGLNTVDFSATDLAGNVSSPQQISVSRSEGPTLIGLSIRPANVTLLVGDHYSFKVFGKFSNGNVQDVTAQVTFSSETPTITAITSYGRVSAVASGNSNIVATLDNHSAHTEVVVFDRFTPDDPVEVASAIDETVPSSIYSTTRFLYDGTSSIQLGVRDEIINPTRIAIIRGRVTTREGTALPGAKITVHNRPEFGLTLSREDGFFDIAVNGGGPLTIQYELSGHLVAQRTVSVPWEDFLRLDDVSLIPLDSTVTTIDFSAPLQVARGSVVTDSDGSRQVTVLFPQQIPKIVLPNGMEQDIPSIQFRASEYTVGPNGRNAMPAPLPPTSEYTYAVELSVDEALNVGALEVRFPSPVILYLENYLNFTVGMIIPAGFYDREKAAWIPSNNGKVVKILSISTGLAEVDTNGDGASDNLGISDLERQSLAFLYQPGQSYWRVPIQHFSPLDLNLPPIKTYNPSVRAAQPGSLLKDPNCKRGSIIECQNQVLGEALDIVGTSFSLNYRTERMLGYKPLHSLEIPLSGSSVPGNPFKFELIVDVAGRRFTREFVPSSNLKYVFEWEGRDAYNRLLNGQQQATIEIRYWYEDFFYLPADDPRAFGLPASAGLATFGRQAYGTSKQRTVVGSWRQASEIGGWSLNVHHVYDPVQKILFLGDGGKRSLEAIITTAAGTDAGFTGDGGPAVQARLNGPQDIAISPEGNLYLVDYQNRRIRKIDSTGQISTFAGGGDPPDGIGDGGPATAAKFLEPYGVALGPDGSVYVSDRSGARVRRIDENGIIKTVAGNGQFSTHLGDGGPATQASLIPRRLAVGQDGSLYITDGIRYVRKVEPDGLIRTIAGNGSSTGGDGGPAILAGLEPTTVVVGNNGDLYIVEGGEVTSNPKNVIRRIDRNGIITTVAGIPNQNCPTTDGIPANLSCLRGPTGMARGHDGSLYVGESLGNSKVRRISPDGIITTFAGLGTAGNSGDNGLPINAQFFPHGLAFAPDGSLYIADSAASRIRRIEPPVKIAPNGEYMIPSADATEVYAFSSMGRHLRTIDALTGSTIWEFSYDSETGLLTQVTDPHGNKTTLERHSSGYITGIVAPFGQRTGILLNQNGYIGTVIDPAGNTTNFIYSTDGLLTQMIDANNGSYEFQFDPLGRLIRDDDAADGSWTLSRVDVNPQEYSLSMTSALGRQTKYSVKEEPTGETRLITSDPAGLKTDVLIGRSSNERRVVPDGTIIDTIERPDPRFGIKAPVLQNQRITTPNGLIFNLSESRTVLLSDPADPLSLNVLNQNVSINGRNYLTTFDAVNRQMFTTTPMGRVSEIRLNALGQVVEQQFANFSPFRFSYDNRGRIISIEEIGPEIRSFSFAYTTTGFVESITNPEQSIISFEYDTVGRLLMRRLADGRQIHYSYDPKGNLLSITPPFRPSHTFVYSPVDFIDTYDPPNISGNGITRFFYNADKQVSQITRSDGSNIDLNYDSAGRLSTISTSRGTTALTYSPTRGTLSTVAAPGGAVMSFSYDGALLKTAALSGPVGGSISWNYDNNFRMVVETINGTNSVSTGYDNDGLITQVGAMSITRNHQNGAIDATTLGVIRETRTYNSFGEMEAVDFPPLFAASYTRDKLGRITHKLETIQNQTDTYNYSYDVTGRLTDVVKNNIPVSHYDFDSNSNRLPGLYDSQDRLLQTANIDFVYTSNGVLSSKTNNLTVQTTTYNYDTLGNLISVNLSDGSLIEYIIDGLNRRIGKKINGVKINGFLYRSGLQIAAEIDSVNNVVSRFIYATRLNVPDYMVRAGVTYRIISDHLGSPRLIVNSSSGAVVQRMDYDEFGNVIFDSNPGFQPFGFAGGLYDQHTRLLRFGARDYDPQTGRWTSKDPVLFAGGDTNLYGYVINDPINFIDSSGLAGHHYFPQTFFRNVPMSKEAFKVFNNATTGPIPGGHGWSKEHAAYSQAVGELWNNWITAQGIDPSQMTARQAEDFLNAIQKSDNPSIRNFLKGIAEKIGAKACGKFLLEYLDKIFHLEMPVLPPEIYMLQFGLPQEGQSM